MALTDITIDFDLAQLLGSDFDPRRTKAYVTTNVESGTLMDTATGETRLGDEAVTIASDGTGSFTTWATGADGNPISWQTSLVVDYPRTGQRDRKRRVFGPWTLTTADDGKNITELEDEQAVPAEYLTQVTAELQTYSDSASASATTAAASATSAAASASTAQTLITSDLGTTDGQTRALVEDPNSQTSGALAATIASEIEDSDYLPATYAAATYRAPEQNGAVADGVSDDSGAFTAAFTASKVVKCKPGKTYVVGDLTIPSGSILDLNGAALKRKVGAQHVIAATSYRPIVVNGEIKGGGTWVATTASAGAILGATALTVTSATGLVAGMKIVYTSAWADGGVEINEISSVVGTTVNLLTPTLGAVTSGVKVLADFPLVKSTTGRHGVFQNLLLTDFLVGLEAGGEAASGSNTLTSYTGVTFSDYVGAGLFIGPNAAAESFTDIKVNGGKTLTANYTGDGTTVRFAIPYNLRKQADRWGTEPSIRFYKDGVQQAVANYTLDLATMEIVATVAPANGVAVQVINYEYSAFGIVARNIATPGPSSVERITSALTIACRVGIWFDKATLGFLTNVQSDTCSYAALLFTDCGDVHLRGVDGFYSPFGIIIDAACENMSVAGIATTLIPNADEFSTTASKTEITVRSGATNIAFDELAWLSKSGYTRSVAAGSWPTGKQVTLRPTGLAIGGNASGLAALYGTSSRYFQVSADADSLILGGGSGTKYLRADGTTVTLDIGAVAAGGVTQINSPSGVRLKVDASGRVILTLPTSSAGLPSGALWSNAGVVNIVP